MDLINAVRLGCEKKGINGVMQLTEHCGLSYERTRRIWEGSDTAKLADIKTVMESLNYVIKYSFVKVK